MVEPSPCISHKSSEFLDKLFFFMKKSVKKVEASQKTPNKNARHNAVPNKPCYRRFSSDILNQYFLNRDEAPPTTVSNGYPYYGIKSLTKVRFTFNEKFCYVNQTHFTPFLFRDMYLLFILALPHFYIIPSEN